MQNITSLFLYAIPTWWDSPGPTAGALCTNLDVPSGGNTTVDSLGSTFPVVLFSQAENLNILI